MQYTGNLEKMSVRADENNNALYTLALGDDTIDMNALIGKEITLTFENEINCIECGVLTEKSHRQGHCAVCVENLRDSLDAQIKPELCGYDEYVQPHFVYLSHTGKPKIGITRHVSDGVSTRWIDQGATTALPIIETKSRRLSGDMEMFFKQFVSDRTQWQLMLTDVPHDNTLSDLFAELREKAQPLVDELNAIHGDDAVKWLDNNPIHINYPVNTYPGKVKSHNLDKNPVLKGTLNGIKAQYLLIGDLVINLRKYSGYKVTIASPSE